MTARTPTRFHACAAVSAAAALSLLAGCSTVDGVFSGSRVDYRSEAAKTPELEVPPDLTQLARDSRYRPQSGVVTASGVASGSGASTTAATTTNAVALNALGGTRIERQGDHRWLVTSVPPEQLWPALQSFWQERGFTLSVDNPQVGVMETNWAENRAKIPQDALRRTLGRLIENLYDSGTRDSFRTRVERTPTGTEVYILHRGMVEQVVGQQKDQTVWRVAPNDPQLEAEFLARLLIKLGGGNETTARQAVANAPAKAPASTVAAAPRPSEATSLEINEAFDRAYRRVGLALDRTGFSVEDRDRSAGLFFVRYVAPGTGEDAGFFGRLFGGKDAQTPVRYRVLVRAAGEGKSVMSVQNSQGQPETGDVARRIVSLVAADLQR
ncbi:MAG: outer membrane protein assembly factor BamC [Rubrivivax sp.]|jgi:outer membrane protein assembly factor BamC|nr:outer membrane protein assembly factor BamC [Rubrivivax sp.]